MAGLINAPGTATFTNDSPAVTGSGTNWTVTARAGMLIRSRTNKVFYQILTVNSDTSITLVENWVGTSGSTGFEILPWFSGQDDAPTALSAQIGVFLAAYAALFAVSGNDKTLTFNKGTLGAAAGAIFQVAGVGYFRVGMVGDGVFRLERSADGTNWTTVFSVDRASGAVVFAGPVTFGSAIMAHSYKAGVSPATAWTIDVVEAAVAVASGSFINFPTGSGLIVVTDHGNGQTALLLCGAGTIKIVDQTGDNFVIAASPPAGKVGFAFNTVANYYLVNAAATTRTFGIALTRTRDFV